MLYARNGLLTSVEGPNDSVAARVPLQRRGELLSVFVEIGTDLNPKPAADPHALIVRRLQLFGENDTLPRDEPGGSTSLLIQMYRGLIPAADAEIDRVIAMRSLARYPVATGPALGVMQHLSRSLVDDSHLPFSIEPAWARALGQLIRDLTGVAPSLEIVNAARSAQISRAVERFASDSRLTPAALADALGISRRTLYVLTAPELGGISEYIRIARARHAARMLVDREFDILPVSAIALRAGFSSPKHLTRALASVYGTTAAAIRSSRTIPPILEGKNSEFL